MRESKSESYRPRLSNFNGSTQKNSTPYDVWRYEVTCLLAEHLYSTESILEAVRRSVRGGAERVLMRLGPRGDIRDILQKPLKAISLH